MTSCFRVQYYTRLLSSALGVCQGPLLLHLDDTFQGLHHYPLPTLLSFGKSVCNFSSHLICLVQREPAGRDRRLAGLVTAVQSAGPVWDAVSLLADCDGTQANGMPLAVRTF
jgi:hypothetical protein